jgi:hypothetical protein
MFDAKTYAGSLCMPALAALLALASFTAHAQTQPPIDLTQAQAAFDEARQVTDRDGGRMWRLPLYGAMFFVDPETRFVVANEPDMQGVLHKEGNVYVGTLPASVIVSNAPCEWGGKRWTMLMWPIYDEGSTLTRHIMFAHELFHRIQPSLRLAAPDSLNLQLDTAEGRLWLQLEWRALGVALIEKGPAQTAAIRDALAFRIHRHALFAGSAKSEASLEIAEGVPEDTGVTVGSPDIDAARWRTIAKLVAPDQSTTFVRSFAYTSGPAYGLLLDQRLPGWRTKLTTQSDLGDLLASTLHGAVKDTAEKRAGLYGASAIRMAEADRSAKAEAVKARYRALLIDGPTLTLPKVGHFAFSFNPSAMISLGDAGAVNPTFHVTDSWGTLDVKDGTLVPTDFSRATVAAPADIKGPHVQGPGWTLDLAPGWHIVPAAKSGSYIVQKE